jgi:DNA-K related protein
LWTQVFAGASKRRRSSDHERVMFQLLGFCLRPGLGYALDAWRCEQTFTLFSPLLTFHLEPPVWAEFWVLWRRISSGLSATAQNSIFAYLHPHLQRVLGEPGVVKPRGVIPLAADEMLRCAASLESVSRREKAELGHQLLAKIQNSTTTGDGFTWALGRLGSRVMIGASNHEVVDAEVAAQWAEALLAVDFRKQPAALFALVLLTRLTDDRSRDVSPSLRAAVAHTLQQQSAPKSWLAPLQTAVALSGADEARVLGEAIPLGLTLTGSA